jgi:putative OPT family oligopeptide transporter
MAQTERPRRAADEPEEPYIPASTSLPEITARGIILGIFLAVVLAGANAYLGLKAGLTVSASIPAAVISMAVLRFFRGSNILENNIVQTVASAGESLTAGVIFTLPALVILHYWEGFPFLPVAAMALCGGTLGVIFTVPLRRALIMRARLRFPEGVAAGEVLKSGSEGGEGAKSIAVAGIAAALLKLFQTGFQVLSPKVTGAVAAGVVFGFGSELDVVLLGVGYIVGLNIAVLVFAGGFISWFLAIPIYALIDPSQLKAVTGGAQGYDAAQTLWAEKIRYLGVGAMAVGGVWALLSVARSIRDSISSSLEAVRRARSGGSADIPRTERDTPVNILLYVTLAMAVPIFLVFLFVVDQGELGIGGGIYLSTIVLGLVFALVAGFFFSAVSGYMTGLVGASNNPVSGVTIATVLTASLVLLVLLGSQIDFDGPRATAAAATALLIGGVVSCAAAMAGDNLHDLKAGYIVGSTPHKQQIMLVLGVVVAAVCVAPIFALLFEAYGIGDVFPREGMDTSQVLAAPQATLMASVAKGVFAGGLPWGMVAIGAAIAVAIVALDMVLQARGATFRTPVLAVAVGLYLPLELSVPVFLGGVVAYLAGRSITRRREELGDAFDEVSSRSSQRGLLVASGFIAGAALVGIVLAIPFVIAQSTDVLALTPETLGLGAGAFSIVKDIVGLIAFALFATWLYRAASRV